MPGKNFKHQEFDFRGRFTEEQIQRLITSYGSQEVVPGSYRTRAKADASGMMYIPGCVRGEAEVRRRMERAIADKEKEEFAWWAAERARLGIQSITFGDVLRGLTFEAWSKYLGQYHKAHRRRVMKRWRASKRA